MKQKIFKSNFVDGSFTYEQQKHQILCKKLYLKCCNIWKFCRVQNFYSTFLHNFDKVCN